MNEPQHGYLLLADISGYTSYVASTELTHAQEILSELLELIIARFTPMLTISKIEGDAVFAYAPEVKIPRGESILELVESTYVAFRARREAAHRRTTCTCNACRNISNLDLKFVVHHGEYLVQNISGVKELIGSDVNLIHRLTKNHLGERTGWRAYAMFTRQSLSHLDLPLEGLLEQTESYEHLGEVRTLCMDLHARYKEWMETRRAIITPQEAHYILEYECDAPPEIVWEWFNDPRKRIQWETGEVRPVKRPGGRTAPGSRNHCVHGKNQTIVEELLDIRPFDYFTISQAPPGFSTALLLTVHFTPFDSGKTHLTLAFKGHVPHAPQWFRKWFCRFIVRTQTLKFWKLETINHLIMGQAV
jgi:uncharacterized protein YndB with AHSA1/START domain